MSEEDTGEHWAGEDKDLQSFAETKGFKDGATALTAYRELEKLQGKMVTLPGEDATDDDWDKFTGKLRPRNVGAYADQAPEGLPEGTYDEGIAAVMKQAAHDAGIPPKLFSKLWGKYWETVGGQLADLDTKAAQMRTDDEKTQREAWGTEFDKNLMVAERAMEKTGAKELLMSFGIDTHPVMRNVFHQLGLTLEESQPPTPGGGDSEEAQAWFTDYAGVGEKK
jgi:hypothetical protein